MDNCLTGKSTIPDRPEKVHDWNIFTSMILATWIRRFTLDNPNANKVAKQWADVIESAFSGGVYNHNEYVIAYHKILGMKPNGGRKFKATFFNISVLRKLYATQTQSNKSHDFVYCLKNHTRSRLGRCPFEPDATAAGSISRYGNCGKKWRYGGYMNNVNKTSYIPLYGKAYVSRKGIILQDIKAEEIWNAEGFELKGKSNSKWLAYYMGMRSAVFDDWLRTKMSDSKDSLVIHIGCGMDSRVERVGTMNHSWYDVDFPEVIQERKRYYNESNVYHMIESDVRNNNWIMSIPKENKAIIVMEGVSMYLSLEELKRLLEDIQNHFEHVNILMDCYTEFAAKASKYKNPINDVGVTVVYGIDNPKLLEDNTGISFVREHEMTPDILIDELKGMEKIIFKKLFGGGISKKMYRLYEYKSI